MIYASAASRSTRRDGRMRKPPPAILGDYLFGGTALKQAREHTTSASITSMKEKVLDLHDLTAFPAFGKSGGGERGEVGGKAGGGVAKWVCCGSCPKMRVVCAHAHFFAFLHMLHITHIMAFERIKVHSRLHLHFLHS